MTLDDINATIVEIETIEIKNETDLEKFRLQYLSKKGKISVYFEDFKLVSSDDKRILGKPLNVLKSKAQEKFDFFQEEIGSKTSTSKIVEDYTRPISSTTIGALHPLSSIKKEIIQIFEKIGFVISTGPEIEDDWHNFSALNFGEDHPARDMQDTFFISNDISLRTHTSSVQVRVMEGQKPPIRTISPGRVYRNEAISARAHCQFHQIEGLYIDKNVSFADLRQTLLYFSKELFGEKTKIRLRPSYFPFTEPSAEMDISCPFCNGNGCNICKGSTWVEILGCGMVDPNVLENCGIDSKEYSGFAFGMGIERIAMLKYKVNDLRHFFENDTRFLHQFKGV
jgi:phenylalanyl-tRNA synthetase alpha chain